MPRLTRIYTRTGDDGTTALGSRRRVSKDDSRVKAYGDVDELNAAIGVALASNLSPKLENSLAEIQNDLFNVGAVLAFPEDESHTYLIPRIESRHILKLESLIDGITTIVGSLENFILPSGSLGAAQLHLARTICRRAERSVVELSTIEKVDVVVIQYLNRLSDALFVMARLENKEKGIEEEFWNTRV